MGPPDEQRPSARDVTSPAQDLASPEELTARLLREWQDEVAASCDPLVRDGFRRP